MNITPIQLATRVEKWGKKLAPLGVGHWSIESVCISELEESRATVETSKNYDECWWDFDVTFLKECQAHELDQVIIHEWVHVAMRDLDNLVYDTAERWLPEEAFQDFRENLLHEREGHVDRVSKALTQLHAGQKPRFSP